MCSRLLKKVPMFQAQDAHFINAVLLKLSYEVFLEGDVIARENAPGDRMFFIDHGEVGLEAGSFQKDLCDGDYFGGGFNVGRPDSLKKKNRIQKSFELIFKQQVFEKAHANAFLGSW